MTNLKTVVAEAVLPAVWCRSAQREEFHLPADLLEPIHMRRSNREEYQKKSRLIDTPKVGRKDRGDVAKSDEAQSADRSWTPGDKGQGREGLSKGYGGSAGKGTGPSGPEKK